MALSDPARKRILLVEDHEDTWEMVAYSLSEYRLICARNFDEGLRLARQRYFDFYILDNWLPDGSGVELCRLIRKFDPPTIAALPIEDRRPSPEKSFAHVLTVDIGGSNIKVLASGQTEPRKRRSGNKLTPVKMVEIVQELAEGWDYEAVSIGYPGLVGSQGPSSEPVVLGAGWVGFDFSSAFGLPVRIMNDAAMQALGSYEGGRMLFLGLGTGVGSALITEEFILTLELGQLPYKRGGTLGEVLGRQGLKRLGKAAWRRAVMDVAPALMKAFLADSVVIGGGNAKKLKELPPGVRQSHNLTAFRGGFCLWNIEDAPYNG